MPLTVTIQIHDSQWKSLLSGKAIHATCKAAFSSKKKKEISVVLASDALVRKLNREFRGQDKPTNVLSFPGEDDHLGDIILARQTVVREAREQRKTPHDHAIHLIVHGMLHLIGHDHMRKKEASKMETREIKILKKLGIKNPYL